MAAPITFDIIVPVRDMQEYILACVTPLVAQLESGDRLLVVDDGSTDATASVARDAGADVIRTEGIGPYAARHLAASAGSQAPANAMSSSVEVPNTLLFIDGRCRAKDGLLESHRRLLATPQAVLSCSPIEIERGTTFAGRLAAASKLFDLESKRGEWGRLPFFPTANLGVRRSAYDQVGGFRKIRSGADIDLCWRIQLAGLGAMVADESSYMTWVPRASLREMGRQWYRYGRSAALLDSLYPDQREVRTGDAAPVGLVARLRTYVAGPPSELPVIAAGRALSVVRSFGYRRGRRELADTPPPASFTT